MLEDKWHDLRALPNRTNALCTSDVIVATFALEGRFSVLIH